VKPRGASGTRFRAAHEDPCTRAGLPGDHFAKLGRMGAPPIAHRIESDDTSVQRTLPRGPTSAPPPKASTSVPPPHEVIAGKYRVESTIGEGGMGVVVLATRLIDGARVAVKVLRAES